MERKEIYKLWIEYLNESNFKKDNGEAMFLDYVNRLETLSKGQPLLTPWPTVQKLSDIVEHIIDEAHQQIINSGKEMSFEKLKKTLIHCCPK